MNQSNDATEPLKEFYVYVLVDPRAGENSGVFYVGKGKGRRAVAHGEHAKRFEGESKNSPRLQRIRAIRAKGYDHVERVIARVDSDEEAFLVEAVLIEWVYGGDQLTNVIGGHGRDYIRRSGDLSLLPRLDVPARVRGERTGDYTKKAAIDVVKYGVEDRLNAWRVELTKRGYQVSAFDASNNRPKVVVELPDPFALHIVARASNRASKKKVVILRFVPSSLERRRAFVEAMEAPAICRHLEDGCVKNPRRPRAYARLAEYPEAADSEPGTAVAAIEFFKSLISSI